MEKMQTESVPENRIEKIITHEGIFHTDEVFGIAILKDLFPESMELKAGGKVDFVKYLRTRDKNIVSQGVKSESTLVADTGGESDIEHFNLDHHQAEGAGARENGIEYATAGLVWKHFGKEWIKYVDVYSRRMDLTPDEIDMVWSLMDEQYVQYMDSSDTGQMESILCTLTDGTEMNGKQFSFSEVIRLYNIDTGDGKTQQDRFDTAVVVMQNAVLSMVNKYMDLMEGLREFDIEKCEFMSDNRAVIIDQSLPPVVNSYIMDKKEDFKDVEYYASQNGKGGYSIMAVPIQEGMRQYRNPNKIPPELRLGNDVKKMNDLLGVKYGITFSHKAGFFAACKSREAAEKFLEYCTKG